MNTQDRSPLGWTGWISLQSKGLSRVFSDITVQKHHFFWCSAFFIVQLSHPYMTTRKTIALTRQTFVGKVLSLLLVPTSICFTQGLAYMSVLLSRLVPPSHCPSVPTSPFSASVSLFLPCKKVHQYHVSRCHIYVHTPNLLYQIFTLKKELHC